MLSDDEINLLSEKIVQKLESLVTILVRTAMEPQARTASAPIDPHRAPMKRRRGRPRKVP